MPGEHGGISDGLESIGGSAGLTVGLQGSAVVDFDGVASFGLAGAFDFVGDVDGDGICCHDSGERNSGEGGDD